MEIASISAAVAAISVVAGVIYAIFQMRARSGYLWARKKEGLSPSGWAHLNYLESFFPPILPLFTFTAMAASYSTPYPMKPLIDLRRRSVPASPLLHSIHLTERFCALKVNYSGGSLY